VDRGGRWMSNKVVYKLYHHKSDKFHVVAR